MDMITTNLANVPERLKLALRAKRTPILLSAPGVGKSSVVKKFAEDHNLKLIDVRLSQMEPTELLGYPHKVGGKTTYIPFDIFPLASDEIPVNPATDKPYNGWLLFLDEAPNAHPQVLKAAYRLILDREVGFQPLHPKCAVVAAGNRRKDRALSGDLGTALQSRMIHYTIASDLKGWSDWAANNGVYPQIIGFVNFAPDLLNNFDPKHNDGTFACERTWEMLSDQLKLLPKGFNPDEFLDVIAGTVGQGAALRFKEFLHIFSTIPKISEIEADALGCPVPSDIGGKMAMAIYLSEHINTNNAVPLLTYLARLNIEAQVVCVRLVRARNVALLQTAAFGKIFTAIAKYL